MNLTPYERLRRRLFDRFAIDDVIDYGTFTITRTSQRRAVVNSYAGRVVFAKASWRATAQAILDWFNNQPTLVPANKRKAPPTLGKHWEIEGRSSRYRYVFWESCKGLWRVQVRYQGKRYSAGYHTDEYTAAQAVNAMIIERGFDLPLNEIPEMETA